MLCVPDPASCQTPTVGRDLPRISPLGNICIKVSLKNAKNPILARVREQNGRADEEAKRRAYELWYRGFLAWRQRKVLYKVGEKDTFKTLVRCGSYAVPEYVKVGDGTHVPTGSPGHVQAHRYVGENGQSLGYAWVSRCASPFFCFHCGARLAAKRREEIRKGAEFLINKGCGFIFVTFTAPHDLETDPGEQVARFQAAQKMMRQGHVWQEFKEVIGFCGHMRATEMTDDAPDLSDEARSGCHWHSHQIWWTKKPLSAVEFSKAAAFLKARWVRCLERVGLVTQGKADDVYRVGCVVELPKKVKAKDPAKIVEYMAKGAGFEIAPSPRSKTGRQGRRVSHWEVLRLAFSGERSDLVPRAVAIMKALKGRAWISWSHGLKAECGIGEKSDAELLKEDRGDAVFDFDEAAKTLGVHWWQINYWKQQARLAQAVELAEKGQSAFAPGVELEAVDAFTALGAMLSAGVDPMTGEDIEAAYKAAVAAPVPPQLE